MIISIELTISEDVNKTEKTTHDLAKKELSKQIIL